MAKLPKKTTKVKPTKTKYPEVKEIQKDIESLKTNTVDLAQHVKKDGVSQVEEIGQTVNDKAQNIKLRGQLELLKAEEHVKQNPLQSIAIAFAGGVLASLLLRGRK